MIYFVALTKDLFSHFSRFFASEMYKEEESMAFVCLCEIQVLSNALQLNAYVAHFLAWSNL